MQAFYGQLTSQSQANSQSGDKQANVLSSAESRLNTTFTKDSETIPSSFKSPGGGSGSLKSPTVPPTSYEMTPAEKDPLFAYENYDIGNLSSDDSTDDEECPKKVIHSRCHYITDTHNITPPFTMLWTPIDILS